MDEVSTGNDEKVNYELSLLVDAIESQLTKEKRRRGRCERSIFILPIQNNIPKDFETIMVNK